MTSRTIRHRLAAAAVLALALVACTGDDAADDTGPASTADPTTAATDAPATTGVDDLAVDPSTDPPATLADIDLSSVTLRVGDQVNITKSGLEAAGQADTPYTIEWASFPSGPPLLEALNADAIDIGGVGDAPPIFAASGGAEIKVVLATRTPQTGQGILVPEGSDVTDVAGLAGRSIAVAKGSSANWVLLKALRDNDLTVDDVTITYLQPAEALAAFQGGDVDAWAVWDPFASLARQDGATFVVTGDELGIPGYGFQVASDGALARPEVEAAIGDFLERLRLAQAWQREHRDEWAATYSELTGLPLEIATEMQRVETQPQVLDDAVIDAQQAEADAFFEAGLIPDAVDFSTVVDDRFNDIALTGA